MGSGVLFASSNELNGNDIESSMSSGTGFTEDSSSENKRMTDDSSMTGANGTATCRKETDSSDMPPSSSRRLGRPKGRKLGLSHKPQLEKNKGFQLVHYSKLTVDQLLQRAQQLPPGLELYDICRTPRVLEGAKERALLNQTMRLSETGLTEDLSCPICMGTYQNVAVVKDCLHRFCEECIERWLRTGHQDCPKCRQRIPSRRSLRADPIFQRIVRRLFPDVARFEELNDRAVANLNHRKIGLILDTETLASKPEPFPLSFGVMESRESPEYRSIKRRRRSSRVHDLHNTTCVTTRLSSSLDNYPVVLIPSSRGDEIPDRLKPLFQKRQIKIADCASVTALCQKLWSDVEKCPKECEPDDEHFLFSLEDSGTPLTMETRLIDLAQSAHLDGFSPLYIYLHYNKQLCSKGECPADPSAH